MATLVGINPVITWREREKKGEECRGVRKHKANITKQRNITNIQMILDGEVGSKRGR